MESKEAVLGDDEGGKDDGDTYREEERNVRSPSWPC